MEIMENILSLGAGVQQRPRKDLVNALMSKEVGGLGQAAEFWDYCEAQTRSNISHQSKIRLQFSGRTGKFTKGDLRLVSVEVLYTVSDSHEFLSFRKIQKPFRANSTPGTGVRFCYCPCCTMLFQRIPY
jgi:hypothetical protein